MSVVRSRLPKIGIFDHTSSHLGGGQLVVSEMAEVLSRQYDVELMHDGIGYTLKGLESAFCVDLSRVKERVMKEFTDSFGIPGPKPVLQRLWKTRTLSRPYDLFIYAGHGVPPFCFAQAGLVYIHFPMESCPDEEFKNNDRWRRRSRLDRLIRSIGYRLLWRIRLKRYHAILANSQFTAGWIERRWCRFSEVVYPPVELEVPRIDKRNIIVSVGRFTGSRFSKNQLGQVRSFRQFLEKVSEDWSLRLIGSCGASSGDQAYLTSVQRAAQGLPIEFLVNVDRKVVCQSLGGAKLFWHTMGNPAEETKCPQDAEHFGIATVEAMRAGCVPIVIASGGQREIVENGVSGFLIKDFDELIGRSSGLAHDDKLWSVMSEHAKKRSMAFTRQLFDQRVMSIVAECLR